MDVDVVGDEEAASKKWQDTDAASGSGSDVTAKSMDVILSEEDESKKKVVYIFMHLRRNAELKVISLDPHKDSGDRFTDKTGMFDKGKPSGLDELFFYTITALGSKVYFIGGKHRVGRMASNRVFAFDTHSEEWVPSVPCLNQRRYLSVVVTYQSKIYVFGNAYAESDRDFHPEYWAEVYHSKSDRWEYLPGAPPPEELVKGRRNIIPALVKHKKIILLCVRYFGVYAYSLDGNCWSSHKSEPNFFGFGLRWSTAVAVLNNTLYWECFGCIFAYDFQPQTHGSVKTYTLPDAVDMFGTPSPYDTLHVLTSLVNAGNGKLCLVYGSHRAPDEDLVCCHTFELMEKFELHKQHDDIYNCVPRSIVVSVVAIEENRERSVMETFAGTTQMCKACENIVSLVDQHTVDDNVYHKACFRSHHSKSTLKVDNRVSDMFRGTQEKCVVCKKTAYPTETVVVDGTSYHKRCFRCIHGRCMLNVSNYVTHEHKLYCRPHYSQLFREKGNFNQLSEHSKVAIENTSD